jgi:hypothetical protein
MVRANSFHIWSMASIPAFKIKALSVRENSIQVNILLKDVSFLWVPSFLPQGMLTEWVRISL